MSQGEITYEMHNLSIALKEYGRLSNKTEDEVIQKQGGKLAYNIYLGLRALKPAKGTIRAERMAALKAGYGVKVRPSVLAGVAKKYGAIGAISSRKTYLEVKKGKKVVAMAPTIKGLNFYALAVQKELTLRESGRGFAARSVPRPRSFAAEGQVAQAEQDDVMSRYGFLLSAFTTRIGDGVEEKYAEMRWLSSHGQYEAATAGLSKPLQNQVLVNAIKDTTIDIQVYIDRKVKENIQAAHLN